jgi:undecaprenyl-diphosphatase
MSTVVPRLVGDETSSTARRLLVGGAVARGGVAGAAVLLAPWLYREHAAVLVLMRPTKEVFLFAGFLARRGDLALPVAAVAALPILLGGVWIFFWLGRSYRKELRAAELPGLAGRVLPRDRIDELRAVLEARGPSVVLLGRLAAFPSTLMAATAGSAGVPWRTFVLADTIGGLASMVLALGCGYVLGEAYEDAGPWLTALGVAVLVGLAVLVGRALLRSGSSS